MTDETSTKDAATPTAPPAESSTSGAKLRLILATIPLGLWFCFLLVQVLTVSNPVILSRPQILTASAVVTGKFVGEPPQFVIENVWRGDQALQGTTIALSGVDTPEAPAGQTFLVPMEKVDDASFRVVAVPVFFGGMFEGDRRRVYRWTPAVAKQLQGILTES
ncbi:hypothetical protein Pan216_20210 [Planctomycetes bacterium Pan216]|uniref:Uncharacterized protein n=1 Tax=Kolteria novifilia TaxID=2527975 RepID=A0A518B2F7_9BACT|nr:hypothetical protein Pan216_20210 [Planctomycetes bacterium Pan216]